MQESPGVEGASVSLKQSPPHAWYPTAHETPHAPPPSVPGVHVAVPWVDAGGAHTVVHEPQWFTSCPGSTHVVPHASVLGGVVHVMPVSSGASFAPSLPPLLSELTTPVSLLASLPSATGDDESPCASPWSPPTSAVVLASVVSGEEDDPQ
jgi:hypothetical protein